MKVHQASQPIGVFDSGIGGLTVASAITQMLPNEEIIYLGDTAHLPYGDKSADAIRYYCLRIAKFLIEKNCKMIVVACGSASSSAYDVLVDFFKEQILFVNVVDPLVDAIVKMPFQKVGVIATKATIRSDIYRKRLLKKKPNLDVFSLATPLLAPMIEEGFMQNNISKAVIENYLSHAGFNNMEALLLACTHYPLIKDSIATYFKTPVRLYDSTDIVAQEVREKLALRQLLNPQKQHEHQFFVTDYTASFAETTQLFYKQKIKLEHCSIW